MEKILSQLVSKINEQVAKAEELQKHLDYLNETRMHSEEKFDCWLVCHNELTEAHNVLRSLRQSLFAFRQAMHHCNIDAFYPERF